MTSAVAVERGENSIALGETVDQPAPAPSNQDSAGPVWHDVAKVRSAQPQLVCAHNKTNHFTHSSEIKEERGFSERAVPDSVMTMVDSIDGSNEVRVQLAELILGQGTKRGSVPRS